MGTTSSKDSMQQQRKTLLSPTGDTRVNSEGTLAHGKHLTYPLLPSALRIQKELQGETEKVTRNGEYITSPHRSEHGKCEPLLVLQRDAQSEEDSCEPYSDSSHYTDTGSVVVSAPRSTALAASSSITICAPQSPLSPVTAMQPSSSAPSYTPHALSGTPSTRVLTSYRLHSFSSGEGSLLQSSPESDASPGSTVPIHTRFLEINGYPAGLENHGNVCYCNAVIQLLYHCAPLRLRLLELHEVLVRGKALNSSECPLLIALCAAFAKMHKASNRKKLRRNVVSLRSLLSCVKKISAMFNNDFQHDAHEFAMLLLSNAINEETRIMVNEKTRSLFFNRDHSNNTSKTRKWSDKWRWRRKESGGLSLPSFGATAFQRADVELPLAWRGTGSNASHPATSDDRRAPHETCGSMRSVAGSSSSTCGVDRGPASPLQIIFGGHFASLTACLECERITVQREPFLDISLDIEQGSSLHRCVENFGEPELFYGDNKFHCEHCKKQVVAQKIIRVHRLPEYALLVHLKRFQYDEKTGGMTKKNAHVALPREIDLLEYEPYNEDDDKGRPASQSDNMSDGRNNGIASSSSSSSPAPAPAPDGGGDSGGTSSNHCATGTSSKALSSLSSRTIADNAAEEDNTLTHNRMKDKSITADQDTKGNDDNDSKDNTHVDNESNLPQPSARLSEKLNGTVKRKGRFALIGFVVHSGEGPNLGHYFTCVRHGSRWRRFDDVTVSELSENEARQYWGVPITVNGVITFTSYILLYERVA